MTDKNGLPTTRDEMREWVVSAIKASGEPAWVVSVAMRAIDAYVDAERERLVREGGDNG